MAAEIKFYNPSRGLERLLLFGMEGVGKTRAAMQIVAQTTGPSSPNRFFIIETDNTYDEFLESPNFNHLKVAEEWRGRQRDDTYTDPTGSIYLYRVRNWGDYIWAMEQVYDRVERSDWVIVDNISNMWAEVQTWYVVQAYGKDAASFALDIRKKQIESGNKNHTVAEEQFTDWGAINPQYFENIRKKLQDPRCNVLMLALSKKVDDKERDRTVKATFGPYGVRPEGQKMLAADSRTVLLLTKDLRFNGESYMITSTKDREREKLKNTEWGDFVRDYLVKVGGWKPKRVEV